MPPISSYLNTPHSWFSFNHSSNQQRHPLYRSHSLALSVFVFLSIPAQATSLESLTGERLLTAPDIHQNHYNGQFWKDPVTSSPLLIGFDAQGGNATQDNVIVIDYDPTISGIFNPSTVYGGYLRNPPAVTTLMNTAVIVQNGSVTNDLYGAYIWAVNRGVTPPLITVGQAFLNQGTVGRDMRH
uniref:hypothetical protein n=1 Tax=Providencia sp. PROV111 TaxID=2949822 RepID=UPI00234B004F